MKGFINREDFKKYVKSGMRIMVGGFLSNGSPDYLIDAILETDVKDLTIICNDGGFEDKGVGKLIVAHRVKTLIASHIGTNPTAGVQMQEGMLNVVLVPQGTLVEQIRADGAGLGGILTPTGLNTIVQDGKTVINVKGKDYLLEEPIHADLALLGGAIADKFGNLCYRKTMRNFNPIIATAADLVIASVSEVVEAIDPECVITQYPLVDFVVKEER
jgi:acetate CoA/acetoacetate CoA-transferase alpha subunit